MHIPNPCPMLESRFRKDGSNFYCKGCSKTIYDFRESAQEEVVSICSSQKNICGIFREDQLSHRPKHSFIYKMAFYALVIASWLGLSVKPLNAQTTITDTASTVALPPTHLKGKVAIAADTTITKAPASKQPVTRKKKIWRRRHLTGCPVF